MKDISTTSPVKTGRPRSTYIVEKKMESSHVRVDAEGLRIFNRLARAFALVLLLAAAAQQTLYKRLLDRLDQKVGAHTASMQQTSQILQQGLKRMGDATSLTGTNHGNAMMNPDEAAYPAARPHKKEAVMLIQNALRSQGFNPGDNLGHWDGTTDAALLRFQQANDLEPAGKLDRQTLERLGFKGDQRRFLQATLQ